MATWNDFEREEQGWLEYLKPFARFQEPELLSWLLQLKRNNASKHASVAEHDAAIRHGEAK